MIASLPFARPEAWPLLLVAPLVGLLLGLRSRARRRRLAGLVGPRAAALGGARDPARGAVSRWAVTGGLLLAGGAALHPVWGTDVGEEEERGADIVVCLDVSRSMLARDLAPDRLGRAKADLRALAEAARGDRIGLVLFAGEARAVVPLTQDTASFARMADLAEPTSVGRGGTDLGGAIEQGLALLAGAGSGGGPGTILLLTDGEDLRGGGAAAARRARERGVVVHTVGYATPLGGKVVLTGETGTTFLRDPAGREVVSALDATTLQEIASTTGGTYRAAAGGPGQLVALHRDRIRPLARETFASRDRTRRADRFQAPLLVAFLLGLLSFGLSERRRPRPLVLPHAASRAAGLLAVLSLGALAACGAKEDRVTADALAALGEERWQDAASISGRMVEARDPEVAAFGYFVRGNVAFARGTMLEAEAARPGADPTTHERATAFAEDALAAWRMAAASRTDWPEARRNVERALLRLDRLRERRGAGGRGEPDRVPAPGLPPAPPGTPKPPEPPEPPTPAVPGPDGPPPEERTAVATTELPPAEVARLLEILRRKDGEKRRLREARHAAGGASTADGEQDW